MSQAAADTLVKEGDELFRAERFGEAAARFERAVTVFPIILSAGAASGTRCSAWASRTKLHAHSIKQSAYVPIAPPRCGAASRARRNRQQGDRARLPRRRSRCNRRGPTWHSARHVRSVPAGLVAGGRASACAARDVRHPALSPCRSSRALPRHRPHPQRARARHDDVRHARPLQRRVARSRTSASRARARINLDSRRVRADPRQPRVPPIRDAILPEPGTMVRDVVGALGVANLSNNLPHIYVQYPRAWGIDLPLDEGPPAITLAQVLPDQRSRVSDVAQRRRPELRAATLRPCDRRDRSDADG